MIEHGLTPAEIEARHLTLSQAVIEEIERCTAEYAMDPKVEPRCYICYEAESRTLVNKLIADGFTNREIMRSCEGINARRKEANDDRLINPRGVWYHRKHHFNVDEPAQSIYRGIVERWYAKEGGDFINGVGHAITPFAVLETTMVKGYQQLVDSSAVVPVKDMLHAATKLHELAQADSQQKRMAEIMYEMDRIINAAQEFVPPENRRAFLARVKGEDYRQDVPKAIPSEVAEVREFSVQAPVDESDKM